MSDTKQLSLSWMRAGSISGIAGIAAYLLAAFVPLPDFLSYLTAFAFGPLVSIGMMGLYHGLSFEKPTPLTQIAAMFGVAAGITVLLMLTVQQAIFSELKTETENNAAPLLPMLKNGLNAVHYGMDIAWDVLISTSVVLFGWAMFRNKFFGKIVGLTGVLLGLLLLSFNLWFFPVPPASISSIDWGPFVALWMVVAFVILLRVSQRVGGDRDK